MSVADDGAGFDESAPKLPGGGIENTRERLRVLYGDHALLSVSKREGGGTLATLRVPYRELALEAGVAQR